MKLVNIYALDTDISKASWFLYEMLRNRDPAANISHRKMPTFLKHTRFINSKPYAAWYIIESVDFWVGNCYLTRRNEIGIFLTPEARGGGIGIWAVRELMQLHGKRRYLANIAPTNPGSIDFFEGLGFKLIQHTYESETKMTDSTYSDIERDMKMEGVIDRVEKLLREVDESDWSYPPTTIAVPIEDLRELLELAAGR